MIQISLPQPVEKEPSQFADGFAKAIQIGRPFHANVLGTGQWVSAENREYSRRFGELLLGIVNESGVEHITIGTGLGDGGLKRLPGSGQQLARSVEFVTMHRSYGICRGADHLACAGERAFTGMVLLLEIRAGTLTYLIQGCERADGGCHDTFTSFLDLQKCCHDARPSGSR